MGRNCKETHRKNRKLDQEPLERHQEKAILPPKMPNQIPTPQFPPPKLHQELELGWEIRHHHRRHNPSTASFITQSNSNGTATASTATANSPAGDVHGVLCQRPVGSGL